MLICQRTKKSHLLCGIRKLGRELGAFQAFRALPYRAALLGTCIGLVRTLYIYIYGA